MQNSTLPYAYPAFDTIRSSDFAPALQLALQQHQQELRAIAENKEAASFDNTILALEKSGRDLKRITTWFFNLNATHTNPELQALAKQLAPQLAAHQDELYLNDALFTRVLTLYRQKQAATLHAESRALLQRYYHDFVRAGAQLDATQKARLKQINARLASAANEFSQNVLNATNKAAILVKDKHELDGLSEDTINSAAKAATENGQAGAYQLALINTSVQPVLAQLKSRNLREQIYRTSIQRASAGSDWDNHKLVLEIAGLRAERANLLGYPHHAAFQIANETAKESSKVNHLLAQLAPAALRNAKAEAQELQLLLQQDYPGAQLAPWDWAYYSEKLRKQKFDLDDAQLRPYFEVNNVLEKGVFFAAEKLYGLQFRQRSDLPVYHDSVRVFEVFDDKKKSLGLFIVDLFARPSKRGGAWMNNYQEQSTLFQQKPVVANHLNITPPANGGPALLSFDEVRTLFHEFGHALHGLLSDVKYPRFSGTSVPRDFVEYPSQVNEMWATWPSILQNYARHYQTGEAIPATLLQKIEASKRFNQGFATTEYLAAAVLDQAWHQLSPHNLPKDAAEFEHQALRKAGLDFAPIAPRYRSSYFSHIFAGGYAASYYAYIWSEVLDADTVRWFEQNQGLQRKNGDKYRRYLLAKGGSVDVLEAYKKFRGSTAKIDALLERRGLK